MMRKPAIFIIVVVLSIITLAGPIVAQAQEKTTEELAAEKERVKRLIGFTTFVIITVVVIAIAIVATRKPGDGKATKMLSVVPPSPIEQKPPAEKPLEKTILKTEEKMPPEKEKLVAPDHKTVLDLLKGGMAEVPFTLVIPKKGTEFDGMKFECVATLEKVNNAEVVMVRFLKTGQKKTWGKSIEFALKLAKEEKK
jgi:hypothetical protein